MSAAPIPFDPDVDGPLLEELRQELRKAGPTSGIYGRRAAEFDALLIRVGEFVARAALKRRERVQLQEQQAQQGEQI